VIDAVEAAGGALPKARLASVNLARVLTDGEQVRVGIDATRGQQDDATGPTGTTGPLAGAASDAGIVDLNVASAVELEELPGIGPVLAGRIVAYRDQNGPFRSVDQLIEVPGIGPAVLSGLADRARV
jgi:competence protein ComEA